MILAVVAMLVCPRVFGQTGTVVSGLVKDNAGEPLIGAVVALEDNMSVSSVTDIDGRYVLTVPSATGNQAHIKVSILGFKDAVQVWEGRQTVNFVLSEDIRMLEETVVVGYGAMRKSDLTGSLTSVKVDGDYAARTTSLDQMLTGAAAGVDVISNSAAPGAGVSIRIRGVTSLNGSSEPLYVVDGIIMSDAPTGSLISGEMEEESNGLLGINPQDIASIEILKDASATAIYGSDGANGVVLITTKQGNSERPRINVNYGLDFGTRFSNIDMLSFDEYVEYLSGRTDTYAERLMKRIYSDVENREGLLVTPVNWQDYAMHDYVMNHRVYASVSGSANGLNYAFSLGYNNNDGIVRSTGVDTYTIRLNAVKAVKKKFRIGTKINFGYVNASSQQGANSNAVIASNSMMKSIVNYRPFIQKADADTEYDEDLEEDEEVDNLSGPDKWLKHAKATRKEYRITPSLYLSYKFFPWMTLRTDAGADIRIAERTKWKGRQVSRSVGAVAGVSESEAVNWNWDTTLELNHQFGRHRVSGTLGATMGQSMTSTQVVTGTNILQEALQVANINSAFQSKFGYSEIVTSKASFFARGIYNYADRYVLTATYRLDGSSRFQKGRKFSGFPSMAFAWRFNEEPWFVVPVISLAKLRLGWGQVGKSTVSPYQTYNVFTSEVFGNHFNDAEYIRGLMQENFSNPDLKWETTRSWNLGLDLQLWRGRLALSADLYDKTTFDLLQKRKIPLSSGYSVRWVNQGTINNRGIELSIDAIPVATKDFEWALRGNISFNRNTLRDLGFAVDKETIYLEKDKASQKRYYLGENIASSTYLRAPANIFIEGMPIGLFYGYKTDGIVQEGETGVPLVQGGTPQQPGQIKYVDMNGNGYIDDQDRTVIGDNNPDFTYGFSTSLSYKGLMLSVAFDGVWGKEVLNANIAQETDPNFQSCSNLRRDYYYNAWTQENPSDRYFALGTAWSNSEKEFVTDRYVEDASYLRMSNLSLNYDVPIKKNKVLGSLNLGLSVGNVFVLTRYSGWSPIVNSFGGNMSKIGVDIGSYPLTRTYSFDIKFTF